MMKNQFRYDGEMPPEIAAHFPIEDKRMSNRRSTKPKAKRMAPDHRHDPPVFPQWSDVLSGIIWLVASVAIWGLIVVIGEYWDILPNRLVVALIALSLVGGALAKWAGDLS